MWSSYPFCRPLFKTLKFQGKAFVRAFFCMLLLVVAVLPAGATPEAAAVNTLITKGNAAYAQKQSYADFQQSLRYFDSAQIIAERSGEKMLLAKTTFARGRIYDAWNKDPKQTVVLFTAAAKAYGEAGDLPQYFYITHLVAHAYEKMRDTAHTVSVLRTLWAEVKEAEIRLKTKYDFVPEMALVATEVGAYSLADSVLRFLSRRENIKNDPVTYNYLDHYYLTQSRLDVYWRKNLKTRYPDSFAQSLNRLEGLFDKVYYAENCAGLYEAMGQMPRAYRYLKLKVAYQNEINADNDYEKMRTALAASEVATARRKTEYETVLRQSRTTMLWRLVALLGIIVTLLVYVFLRNKKYRAQSVHLKVANVELDMQVSKVELLNKEIQHRIKNNLYTIYSLLHMQQESTNNEEVIAHLEVARLRVESVAALHNHLLAGSETVDFRSFVKELVSKVVACLANRQGVVTHIEASNITLPLNTCFALSLILNEWITNAIKYASPKGETLNLDVRIVEDKGEVCLAFSDDGIPARGQESVAGLGTKIVRLLTLQVKGKLTVKQDHPYHYTLCIPHGKQD